MSAQTQGPGRYVFPRSLGGGAHVAATGVDSRGLVGFDLPDLDHRLWLSRAALREIKEQPLSEAFEDLMRWALQVLGAERLSSSHDPARVLDERRRLKHQLALAARELVWAIDLAPAGADIPEEW